ncbi:mannosyltransferase [Mortierella antarctica]|nr:mannosyltransferase [Mortierella antarctica]
MPSSAAGLSQRKKAPGTYSSTTAGTTTTATTTTTTSTTNATTATTTGEEATSVRSNGVSSEASSTATSFKATKQVNGHSHIQGSNGTNGNSNGTSNVNGVNGHGHVNGGIKGALSSKSTTDDEQDSDASSDRFETMDEITRWRTSVAPYCPSYSVAFKAIFVVRALAATFSNISDCDEVFNFWEPMHYLQYGTGLETWEYSPVYAIRSWAYILVHALPAEITRLAMSANRLQVFFILRIILGAVSAHCEATLYRAVVDEVDPRIGRYLLLALVSSAGTWIASNAFLPSTFAMYTTMLFFSQMLQPPRQHSVKRTFWAIFWVGLGALLGWPFSAAVGLPFALEELLIHSRNQSKKKTVRFRDWRRMRFLRLVSSSILVLGIVLIPLILIDHYYYDKFVVVPLNIVLYNVFGGDVGPNIFGTEPWWFYILNGLLNFNLLFLAALLSFPALVFTFLVAPDVIPNPPSSAGQLKDPLLLFTLKLSPFYLWFAIFTAQPHKEERFLFVVYPLICFNAVMTLFIAQKLAQRGLDRFVTRSKTAAIHKYSRGLVWVILIVSAAVSVSRILALYEHYSAPIDVYRNAFDMVKVPEPLGASTSTVEGGSDPTMAAPNAPGSTVDALGKKEIIRVCVGKEWYRFPSHYFLPEGARLGLIKSHFDGLLPGEFYEQSESGYPTSGKTHHPLAIDWRWSAGRRPGTSHTPTLMNNENKEVVEHYTPLEQCHYLVDLDYSGRPEQEKFAESSSTSIATEETSDLEPRYLQNKEQWEKLYCRKFLDTTIGAGRNRWVRAFWIPDKITLALTRGQPKAWGDYCLARRK